MSFKKSFYAARIAFESLFAPQRIAQKINDEASMEEVKPSEFVDPKRECHQVEWRDLHPMERQFSRPAWIGKPRPSIKALFQENMRKEVLRRSKEKMK